MFGSCDRKKIQYVPFASANDIQNSELEHWKWSSIAAKFWIMSLIFGGCLYFFDYVELKSISIRSLNKLSDFQKLPVIGNSLNGYVINTPGCRIPDMDPFDLSVKKFIYKPKELVCDSYLLPLFQSNFTSIYMITQHLPLYNVTNATELNCCYKEFKRLDPKNSAAEKQVSYSNNCIKIESNAVTVKGEFIQVICKNSSDNNVYEDYFSFVPIKQNKTTAASSEKPNILIIGVDAVSRLNLHRQLPNTYKYLTTELDVIELLGYNKVADNTFPNLIPVFTGMFESELKKSCYPNSKAHFDKCPFLWKNYSAQNYVTAVGEDCAWIGLFNYQKVGFKKQTSDYYYTTFSREIENNIGKDTDWNCDQCVGGRETYKLILEYIKKFTLRMKLEATPYFAFFWGNSLSHDRLNRPFLGDQSYYELFKELKETGRLENTVLIFMSDHGIRWGDIRQTYQGQMEERLPFILMGVPKWFKTHYPEAIANLKKNVRRLTTPFDLHETIKDLLDVDNLKNASQYNSNQNMSRGFSLFNEIPKTRTCQDAEIVSHWCTCQQSITVNVTDLEVISAAKFAVNNINLQLEGYADCAILDLNQIINARILTYDSEHITDKKSIKDYTITLKTTPGDAIFEVTVRAKESEYQNIKSNVQRRQIEDSWKNFNITGTISRLNLYGKQSYCITDFHLKLYCYCKGLLKS